MRTPCADRGHALSADGYVVDVATRLGGQAPGNSTCRPSVCLIGVSWSARLPALALATASWPSRIISPGYVQAISRRRAVSRRSRRYAVEGITELKTVVLHGASW